MPTYFQPLEIIIFYFVPAKSFTPAGFTQRSQPLSLATCFFHAGQASLDERFFKCPAWTLAGLVEGLDAQIKQAHNDEKLVFRLCEREFRNVAAYK